MAGAVVTRGHDSHVDRVFARLAQLRQRSAPRPPPCRASAQANTSPPVPSRPSLWTPLSCNIPAYSGICDQRSDSVSRSIQATRILSAFNSWPRRERLSELRVHKRRPSICSLSSRSHRKLANAAIVTGQLCEQIMKQQAGHFALCSFFGEMCQTLRTRDRSLPAPLQGPAAGGAARQSGR
jgi:hypothetical protein